MMAAAVVASLAADPPGLYTDIASAARSNVPGSQPARKWDWPLFRSLLQRAALPAIFDVGVQAQVESYGDKGDTVNCGLRDADLANFYGDARRF